MGTFLKVVGVLALCMVGGCFVIAIAAGGKVKQQMDAPPVATLAEFEAVQNGMSYDQVVGIVGAAGTVTSSNDIGGFSNIMYDWKNPDFSGMNAMFQNGKLIQKAQFGLK